MNTLKHLMEADPEIYNAVRGEMLRQEEGIELRRVVWNYELDDH